MSAQISPFIYWGQNATTVFIRIALKDVQNQPDVGLSEDQISFKGQGIGAHGDSFYTFAIKPYQHVAPEKSRLRVTGCEVLLDIPKREPTTTDNPWPRLTKDTKKYAWIKPDFDKMDISEDEDEELLERQRMEKEYIDKVTKDLADTQDQVVDDLKKNYLFSYSLFQFLAFGFITFKVLLGLAYDPDYRAYEDVGTVLIICQMFSFLEVVHPMIGLVKTGVIPSLVQTCGRNLILLVVVWNEPKLQGEPATTYLFLFWSIADTIRHPFNMMNSMKVDFYWMAWLRYTMWIPLYPLGAACEWIITWKAIPLYDDSGRFSLELPNSLNFSIALTYYLRLHLLILPPALGKLMLHMYSSRKRKLGGAKASSSKSKKTN